MYAYMYVCICMYICMYTYIRIHTLSHTHTHSHNDFYTFFLCSDLQGHQVIAIVLSAARVLSAAITPSLYLESYSLYLELYIA